MILSISFPWTAASAHCASRAKSVLVSATVSKGTREQPTAVSNSAMGVKWRRTSMLGRLGKGHIHGPTCSSLTMFRQVVIPWLAQNRHQRCQPSTYADRQSLFPQVVAPRRFEQAPVDDS